MICLPPTGINQGPIFLWLVWAIWTTRNYLIFEERIFTPEATILKALVEAREWQLAQSKIETTKPHMQTQKTYRNGSATVTCFTDGSWNLDSRTAGSGWIFLDSTGTEIGEGQSAERFVSSSLMAEAISIRSALNNALEKGFNDLILKSDAQDLVLALTKQEPIKEIYGLLFDIHALASLFTLIAFTFILRSQNSKADSLGKAANSHINSVPTFG
ncbi:unnamed protein product [Microthlaspi erraticum]|uniref:RNase H type-1 domain-containing protein n=1 Tax=Microthlaspi erraticum TaxID=1685480 RepID=A0A6D2J7Q6_9BRAS|nr:unnamed protein product [Microthlaspi erraticum]